MGPIGEPVPFLAAPLLAPPASALPANPAGGRGDERSSASSTVIVGVGGARQNAAVAAVVDGRLAAFCEQERVSRVRSAAAPVAGLPQEALHAVLATIDWQQRDVQMFATGEALTIPAHLPQVRVDHHFGHAAAAALTSPFDRAAVLVCDHHSDPPVSVWTLEHGRLRNVNWPWIGTGFAELYSQCAELMGFGPAGAHKLEALARLATGDRAAELSKHLHYQDGRLAIDPAWRAILEGWLPGGGRVDVAAAAAAASSFQRCIGDALVELVQHIRAAVPHDQLCLGGGLFYNTDFNTRIVSSRAFQKVFVPLNPGNPGIAAGAALATAGAGELRTGRSNPFLGPEYSPEEIKFTLDNCKLTYEYLSESAVVDEVVSALLGGRIVGWFQGRMEAGPRSLGNRSILANPFSRHVLDNLNVFLKQRERYRAYGLSVLGGDAEKHFDAPAPSDYMELEYTPLEPQRYHVLPPGARTVRVQTVGEQAPLFAKLHRAFGAATGAGVLVNTSFNGFHEPIVCSPRDAIRVFYGSGLDMLVVGRFVLRK